MIRIESNEKKEREEWDFASYYFMEGDFLGEVFKDEKKFLKHF